MTINIGGRQSVLAPACEFQRRDVDVLILDAGTRHRRRTDAVIGRPERAVARCDCSDAARRQVDPQ